MRKMFSLLSVMLFAAVIGALALPGSTAFAADPAPKAAAPAPKAAAPAEVPKDVLPAFSLKMLDGKVVTNETIKGKPSAFVFFQTACSLCRVEVEDINQIAQMEAYKGIAIYLVNVDISAAKVLPSFIETNRIVLPVLIDSGYTLAPKFGINATPGAVFLNGSGKVVTVTTGYGGDAFALLKSSLDKIK